MVFLFHTPLSPFAIPNIIINMNLDTEPCRVGGLALTQEALDFCGFVTGSRLVDVGCGFGATVRYLRAAGFNAYGIDCDMTNMEKAEPYCRLGESSALPFEAGSLDGLFFECSLSQMDSCHNVLAEARRVLKDEGKLAISDLYFRSGGQGGLLPNAGEWKKIITEAGFVVLLFEDKSDDLAEFAAQLLWQHGRAGIEKLCGCDMEELKAGRCGYFLLIAQKRVG